MCDSFIKKNLIFHPKHGLITEYPWITEKWIDTKCKEIEEKEQVKANKLYYAFVILGSKRTNLKLANGSELEDTVFSTKGFHFSNNAVMCKLLEKAAKEEEMERYVNDLLGLHTEVEGDAIILKEQKDNVSSKLVNALSGIGHDFQFFKGRGPYERDFNDRIVKWYLKRVAVSRYLPIVGFLKQKIGYGQ